MRSRHLKSIAVRTIIILWTALCVFVFMRYPGSKSTIHESILGNWAGLIPKLNRIDILSYLGGLLQAMFGLLLFVTACIGVGWTGLAIVFPERKTPSESNRSLAWLASAASAFVIGQGLLAIVLFALAKLNQLRPEYVAFTWAAGIALAIYRFRVYTRRQGLPQFPNLHSMPTDEKLMLMLATLALSLSVFYATARISYDATALYFSDAKISAVTHSVAYMVQDAYVASVFVTGIQYAAIIQLFGDQAARLYSWASGLAIIVLSSRSLRHLDCQDGHASFYWR